MNKLLTLDIEGFLSILKHTEDLSRPGINILNGPNGAGKTTLLASLNWVIYGITLKENNIVTPWKSIITKEYLGTKVELKWSSNGNVHHIIRCKSYKGKVDGSTGKDRLLYFINMEHVKEKDKPSIQKRIISEFGMSQSLFKNSVMFGQGMKRLAQETPQDKRALFEEVFDASYLTKARDLANNNLKEKSQQLKLLKEELSDVESEVDALEKKIKYANDSIHEQISNYKSLVVEVRSDIEDMVKSKTKITPESKISRLEVKKDELWKSLSDLNKEKSEIENKLSFMEDDESMLAFIDNIQNSLEEGNKKKVFKLLSELKEALSFKLNYHSEYSKLKESISEINQKLTRYNQSNKHQVNLDNTIAKLEDKLIGYKKKISSLKLKITKPDINDVKEIKSRKAYLEDLVSRIEPLEKEVANIQWLIKVPLSNQGIKAYLFESSLPSLNEVMDQFSSKLGFHMEFGVNLESSRKDFYTLIQMGKEVVDYSELSGGQKQLIHIAMAFATHIATTNSTGLNIIFLDEVFEALSRENIEIVVSLIKALAGNDKTVYVITHLDSLQISSSRIIKVALEKGQTTFS